MVRLCLSVSQIIESITFIQEKQQFLDLNYQRFITNTVKLEIGQERIQELLNSNEDNKSESESNSDDSSESVLEENSSAAEDTWAKTSAYIKKVKTSSKT